MKQPSSQLKTGARRKLTGHWTLSVILTYLFFMISAGAGYLSFLFIQSMRKNVFMVISAFVVVLIVNLLLLLFEAGANDYFLNIARDRKGTIGNLLYAFRTRPDRFIIAGLITTGVWVIYLLPYYIALQKLTDGSNTALLIFIIWGIIGTVLLVYLLLSFSQFIYLLIDDPDCGGIESLKKSAHLMRGNKRRLLFTGISFIGWFFLDLLSAGLASLWIQPYMAETFSIFYLDLIDEQIL